MDANESTQTARDCVNRTIAAECPCCDRKCTKLWQDLLRSVYRACVVAGSAVGLATLIMLYVDVNADGVKRSHMLMAAIAGLGIGFFAQGLRWLPKRGSQRLDRCAIMDRVKSGIRILVNSIRNIWRKATQTPFYTVIMEPLCEIAKALAWGLVAGVYLAVLIFADASFNEALTWAGILATGGLSTVLLVAQVGGWDIFQPKTWARKIKCSKPQTAAATLVVGIATHYAAIMFGVSSATVFSIENENIWSIVAVGIQQIVLTSASWLLVNAYRRSNAVGADRNAQGK